MQVEKKQAAEQKAKDIQRYDELFDRYNIEERDRHYIF